MNFFDYIKNDSFFKPFVSKYRRIYYDCIRLMIDKAGERPVLYESDARDVILNYFQNKKIEDGEEAQELAPYAMIGLFRECGWLMPRELGRNGEYVVNVSPDCRRIMDFFNRLADRRTEGAMSNRIFAMYEIVKSLTEEDSVRKERPYTNILQPLVENMTELRSELAGLKDSITEIMKAVITLQDMNSFGQFIMKDLMLERFFGEYFYIKNNGLIPSQLSFIRNQVRKLNEGELYERMCAECEDLCSVSKEEAAYLIDSRFSELKYFLGIEYEEHMELIDRRINTYYNLANTRISLMASSGMRLDAMLASLMDHLAKMDKESSDHVLEQLSDCIRIGRQQYIGSRSFEKREVRRRSGGADLLEKKELSEEERSRRTKELFENAPGKYNVEAVDTFLKSIMGGETGISTKEHMPRSREEAMMYAAAVVYAKNEEFPYRVELGKDIIRGKVADLSEMYIQRRKENE